MYLSSDLFPHFHIFVCWKYKPTKSAQIVQVNSDSKCIYDHFYFLIFIFYAEKCTKYAQSIQLNLSLIHISEPTRLA